MIRLLFVCHGNICRSTMAESVMTHVVQKAGLGAEFEIDSAAVSREEIGSPVHRGTVNKLREKNVALVEHRARQIRLEDMVDFDYIICMDESNLRILNSLFWCYEEYETNQHKVGLLLDYVSGHRRREVADPWYTGNFEETYEDVMKGCLELLDACIKTHGLGA